VIKGVGGYGEEGRSGEEEREEKGGVEEGRRVWMEDERWRMKDGGEDSKN